MASSSLQPGFNPREPDAFRVAFVETLDVVDGFQGYLHGKIRAAMVKLSAKIAVSTSAAFFSVHREVRERAVRLSLVTAIDLIRNDFANEVRREVCSQFFFGRDRSFPFLLSVLSNTVANFERRVSAFLHRKPGGFFSYGGHRDNL